MAKHNITAQDNLLKIDLVVTLDDFAPKGHTFFSPSVSMVGNKIKFYEGGVYKTALFYNNIGTIGGVAPTSITDAYTKINTLVAALKPTA